jgi:hypothetical protein
MRSYLMLCWLQVINLKLNLKRLISRQTIKVKCNYVFQLNWSFWAHDRRHVYLQLYYIINCVVRAYKEGEVSKR